LVRAALGAEAGTAMLQLHGDPSRSSLGACRPGTVDSEQVSVCQLDSSVPKYTNRPVSFVKLDVEGAEPLAFAGAKRILEQDRPVLLFEFQPSAVRRLGLDPLSMWGTLAELGYRFHRLSEHGQLVPVTAPPASGTHNLIAVNRLGEIELGAC
jgi:Methyltransferase FkbM domain